MTKIMYFFSSALVFVVLKLDLWSINQYAMKNFFRSNLFAYILAILILAAVFSVIYFIYFSYTN